MSHQLSRHRSVSRLIRRVTATCLLTVLVGSCGKPPAPGVTTTRAVDQGAAGHSCAIALIPHAGTARSDREIQRWQAALGHGRTELAYLERLGWAYVAKARVSADNGYYLLAEQTAACLDERWPGAPEALLLRGHVLHQLHRFAAAEAVARRLVQARGLSFDHGLLGDVLMERGQVDAAAVEYQAMMDERPGPQAYARAAHLRWLKGDLSGALQAMRLAVRSTDRRDPDAAWGYVRLASYERQAGHDAQAEALIDEALQLHPDYPAALLERGRHALAMGAVETAIATLARAVAQVPLPDYQWSLIEALRVAHQDAEAEALAQEMKRRGPVEDPRTLAIYLASRGEDLGIALRLARAELKARTDAASLDALAWALRANGRTTEAWALSQRVITSGTRDARLCLHTGVIARAAGAQAAAREWLGRATALQQMLLPSERTLLAAQSRPSTESPTRASVRRPTGPAAVTTSSADHERRRLAVIF
jgi:tetratricopeptide (TPR) repeat protein